MRKVRPVEPQTLRRAWPVLAIEILGYLGVVVWVVLIARTWVEDSAAGWWVTIVGVVLAAAHVVIALGTARRTHLVVPTMWFVLVSDALLTVLVDVRAIILVVATIALLLLSRTRAARTWWATGES